MTRRIARLLASLLLLSQINYCHSSIDTGKQNLRILQNRVDQVDKKDATCQQSIPEDPNAPTGVTQITFYYSVESTEAVTYDLMQNLDRMLYYAIGDAVLWCSQAATTAEDGGRRLEINESHPKISEFTESHRSLALEDARRLGIISFNSAPSDLILGGEACAHSFDSIECVIVEGKMAIMAHQTDGLQIIVASILDALQEVMDGDILIPSEDCFEAICGVDKIRWLGTTIEEARAGGPVLVFDDDDGAGAGADGGEEIDQAVVVEEDDDDVAFIGYAAIPLFLMLLLTYLFKKKRRVLTAGEVDDEENYVRVGTGDPPKSFHEGMYHYTSSGARYLSTNCPDCEMTRRLGFASHSGLPALAEGRDNDLNKNGSGEDSDMSYDGSTFRRMHYVNPSSNQLSLKHSSIDVHQCTSATCPICKYRPKDPSFLSSPQCKPVTTGYV